MGKTSSTAAKDRRTAQRLAERQNKELLAESAAAYTEKRLAGLRAEIKATIPQLGAAMAVKVVDVLCLKTSTELQDEASDRLIDELRGELEVHLEDEGMELGRSQYHPLDVIDALVLQEKLTHNCEMRAAIKAALDNLRTQGNGSIVKEPASMVVLQAAAATATGDKQQVGPGESKAGPRAPGLKSQGKGPTVQGPSVQQQHKGTPRLDLGGRQRLSKPRSLKIVDEIMWGAAQRHALQELVAMYGIPTDPELYYSRMC